MIGFFFFSLAACADLEIGAPLQPDTEPHAPPDLFDPDDGKFDLANDGLANLYHDGRGYRVIAMVFDHYGYDLEADLGRLEPEWPIAGEQTALITRFGTPIQVSGSAHFHTAFDVYRLDPELDSDEVFAPFSGTASVFNWTVFPGYHDRDYSTVVAIWDPESHVIAQFMHVRPSQRLLDAEPNFIDVERGEVIGTLANDLTWLDQEHQERFRHTHVTLIDGGNSLILNPASYFQYRDSVTPTVNELYLLDEDAEKHTTLVSGQLDVVLDVHDRDDDSDRNFEVGSIAYEIVDQEGNVLSQSTRCFFEHLFESVEVRYGLRTLDLIDFGNAQHQIGRGDWPDSDIDDRERSFRYALTQFYVNDNGRCGVHRDYAGFIEISDAVTTIEVRAQVWDQNENVMAFTQTLRRIPPLP